MCTSAAAVVQAARLAQPCGFTRRQVGRLHPLPERPLRRARRSGRKLGAEAMRNGPDQPESPGRPEYAAAFERRLKGNFRSR